MNKFIRINEVAEKLSIGKSTAWLWVKQGKLPKPTKLSERVSVWKLSDIENFMAEAAGGNGHQRLS